jgi:predicted DNA-binding transcriptional regulator YafY
MSKSSRKRDRTARLLRLQVLLWQYPHGIEVEEIARRFSISKRTIYRDLVALESELDVPIWEEGTRRGVVEGYFLPPVTFTQAEAMNIFLAARLMQNYSYIYNPSVVATFLKLNTILPSHLRNQIQNTLDHLEKLPRDERKLNNFNKLTEAWLSRHSVNLSYRDIEVSKPVETTIEPYFIEPSLLSLSSYVIAYCRRNKTVRAFKMDHIIGDVKINSETYEIPGTFNATNYIGSAWDIYTSDNLQTSETIETVKLRFSPKIGKAVAETIWHPSQETEIQNDSSMIMMLKLRNTLSFRTWIMRWEKEVEVLEPEGLRTQITNMALSLIDIYCKAGQDEKPPQSEGNKSPVAASIKHSDLTDAQWDHISHFLPPKPLTGRPRSNDRQTINGILYVLKNRIRWSDLPPVYGAPSTCYTRLQQWKKQGVWKKVRAFLSLTE